MKFKVGDRVKYVSGSHGDRLNNPLWGGKHGNIYGKVTYIPKHGSLIIRVKWDNGKSNSYRISDLKAVVPLIPEDMFKL